MNIYIFILLFYNSWQGAGLPSYIVFGWQPRNSVGWSELSKLNIMIIKADFLNVGQRRACAQPTPWVFVQTLLTIPLETAPVMYAGSHDVWVAK
jgi:hypothetical protein